MASVILLTLLHSLWLGLILAAITGLVLLFTRQSSASLRYNLLTGCLALFACTMLAITCNAIVAMLHSSSAADVVPALNPFAATNTFASKWGELVTAANDYASYIVWAWAGVIGFKALQLLVGLYKVSYMRRNNVYDAGQLWMDRVNTLSTNMGIRKQVRIMQSGIAQAPLALGYLKPLILFPVGLINNLSVAEVDAIICHELAHIKRRDYLVNLLQSLMDILFFFNPAVMWLNKLIREERELCCDDMALAANVGVQDYVSALVSCGEFQLSNSNFAMAFAGNKEHLIHRVKRLIGQQTHNVSLRSKVLLALLVCATILLAITFSMPDGVGTHITNIRIENPEMVKEIKVVDQPEPAVCKTQPVAIQEPEAEIERIEGKEATSADGADAVPGTTIDISCDPIAPVEKEAFTDQDGDDMNAELRTDGIITTARNTSYQLDDKKLIVNNVQQPTEVHKKYFEKYLKYNGRAVCYNATYKGYNH